ncbi:MAG: MATE family efflux transporter [Lachnospiraceae bacterium]
MRSNVKEAKKQMMLTESIKTLIPRMAVPTIMAQLITTLYNLVDTFFVSTLGTSATAAVGVNSSLERMITLIGSLIGAGACSYIARLLGAKKEEHANKVLSTSFFSGLGLGVIFMIGGIILMKDLVFWLGATEDCAVYSMQYATYVLYAAPFMIGSFILNMCLRSEGSALYSMIGIGFGGVLNCFLDPLFIYTFGLGVAGASMATAISKFISFCILCWPYFRKTAVVTISIRKFKLVIKDIKEVLLIGSSSFFRSLLTVAASVSINRVAGGYSTAALAALSVATRVMDFPFAFILGFGQGYQPVVGFNWGAKAWKRVKESYIFSCIVAIAGAIVMGAIIFTFATPIIHLFNKQADADVLALGLLCIRLQCFVLVFHSLGSLVNMFYAGIGNAKYSLIVNFARQGYCFYPALLIAPMLFGINGVAATQSIADLLSAIVIIPLGIHVFKTIKIKEAEEPELMEAVEPEQQVTIEPEQNEVVELEQQVVVEPEQNETEVPEQQVVVEPEQNETEVPEQQVVVELEQNEDEVPEQQVVVEPEQNEDEVPEQNETEKPDQNEDVDLVVDVEGGSVCL